jgi:hypothetical protein
VLGGYCWWKAPDGLSRAKTWTSIGMAYDPATATYAGSGGSDANCIAVAAAIFNWTFPPAPPIMVQALGSSGVGRGDFNFPAIVRDVTPTTAEAVDAKIGRFCACQWRTAEAW